MGPSLTPKDSSVAARTMPREIFRTSFLGGVADEHCGEAGAPMENPSITHLWIRGAKHAVKVRIKNLA